MSEQSPDYWDYEIKAESSIFNLKLKETWAYRDLLFLLVRRDFVSFYKQTILGPLWFFIQPVATIIIYTIVFGNLAGISTSGLPKPLFYLAGTILWNYFSDCLSKTSGVFRDNAGMMGKVYFPRLIMPLSVVCSSLIKLGVQFVLFVCLLLYFKINGYTFTPNGYILLFPLLILILAGLGLGLGMILSAVTTKYRDLSFVISFGIPLLMYTTTVIYPLSEITKKYSAYKGLILYNPITSIIETFRYGFLGTATFSWQLLGYSCVFTLVTLIVGTIIFNKVERSFIDTI
ncbi:ABC transporter permease [Mucilaginibacter koreensis]